jgi:hypothetical protein
MPDVGSWADGDQLRATTLNAKQNGVLSMALDQRVTDAGTSGSPITSDYTLSMVDAATGITRRSAYLVMYLGGTVSLVLSNLASGVVSGVFVEVHQVGGPWTLTTKLGGSTALTAGGAGIYTTATAGAIDMISLWTPDGSSLRGSIDRDWS